jgi:hypothetical protein
MAMTETRTDSADLTFERFKAALGGAGDYPKGAVFVDAEAPFAGSTVVRNVREGLPVVLVYPDGLERVVGAPISRSGSLSILAKARGLGQRMLLLLSF